MSLPNFIVSGFPKCGSTALHYYLNEHPEIFMPKQKELHFFTSHILGLQNQGKGDKEIKKTQIKTQEDYNKCYNNVKDEIAIGDASPSYINYPSEFKNIKTKLNNPKVIILLRDPIKRAHSNYLHLVRAHRETLSFYDALIKEEKRKELSYSDFWYYTFNSLYFDKIKEAKNVFDEVLIITQEELSKNTEITIKKVFQFLEVDSDFKPSNLDKRYNPGGTYKSNFITKIIFKDNSFKTAIKKSFPIPVWLKHLKQRIIKKFKVETPEIDIKTETYLSEVFKDDVNKIKTLNVDVSKWNSKYFQ
ncbi:sulfotransferase family protein [Psychroserpens luteus]|uniref:Sulfotransferase family protein n=1 Tax=Psychroserpens luteus TaxID=1434066 RepID=A0ABW5ZXC8_9FLAO|nr:sulfotransferase [Psychroserpens luteus]